MRDFITGFLAVLMLIFIALIAPLQQNSAQVNSSVQSIVAEDVNCFVEKVRSQGYITGQDYRKFLDALEGTGNIYDISVTVLSETYYPSENDIKYEAAYIPDSQSEIVGELGKLTVDDVYSMKNGDYITVSVKQASVSIAKRLANIFLVTKYSPEIYYTYGAGVGNEAS